MSAKAKQVGGDADLSVEWNEMRLLTKDYEVPTDGCNTYAAVNEMLEKADKAYHE